MQVDVISSINEARSDDFIHKTVVVIDVLRATSVIITAIANECSGIIPIETVQQAKKLHSSGLLLGGERYCKKIPGFDLGNSPFEYTPDVVRNRKIIMTTTNGTRAVQKSQKAAHVLAGAMINAHACASAILHLQKDVSLLCAGTNDVFSLEDGLCAGLIVHELLSLTSQSLECNDFALAMLSAYRHVQGNLEETLFQCANGKKMCKLGFEADVTYCAKVNFTDTVPILCQDTMIAYPHEIDDGQH